MSEVTDPALLSQLNGGEVTDPALLSQLNQGMSLGDIGGEVAKKVASGGTGLVRGLIATGMSPFDITNMMRPNFDPNNTLGKPYPGTSDVLPDIEKYLYQPEGGVEKTIAAATSALPAAAGNRLGPYVAQAAGGALGQFMADGPALAGVTDPNMRRFIGNIVPALAAPLARQVAPTVGNFPVVGKPLSALGSEIKNAVVPAQVTMTAENTPSAQRIAQLDQEVPMRYPQEQIDRMWAINRQRTGPTPPDMINDPPIQKTVLQQVVQAILRAGRTFGLGPEVQNQLANQPGPQ